MLLLAHYNTSKNEIKKKGVEREMFRKNETKSLLKARTIALKRAEFKIEQKEKQIKELQEEAEILIGVNAGLRSENLELQLFKDKVVNIMNKKATLVKKCDEIKELVDNLETEN